MILLDSIPEDWLRAGTSRLWLLTLAASEAWDCGYVSW